MKIISNMTVLDTLLIYTFLKFQIYLGIKTGTNVSKNTFTILRRIVSVLYDIHSY